MQSKRWGGVFLVCGTSIGTGILGIPSMTGACGFAYSVVLLVVCWFFSAVAALLLLEAHCWQRDLGANLLSMTRGFFGQNTWVVVWIVYLALLYSLMCTYLLAGSGWVADSLWRTTQITIPQVPAMLMFIAIIGLFICFGIRVVDRINRLMSIGLMVSLMAILGLTLPEVTVGVLLDKASHLSATPAALPLLITAFGYSIIVPTLNQYFNKQTSALQSSILLGSLIALVTYLLWELATLGNIPWLGRNGLRAIASSQDNGTEVANALIYFSHHQGLSMALTMFAVFAVITSFLGVSMALFHALADGLTLRSRHTKRLTALSLTYIPPMMFLSVFPTGFNQILSWAGSLVALLLGILPALMVWKGRYGVINQQNTMHCGNTNYRVWGGKPLLISVLLFFCGVVLAELFS